MYQDVKAMEEQGILSKFGAWVLGIIGAIITFIAGLLTKLRIDVSTLQKDIAVNTKVSEQLKEELIRIELVIKENERKRILANIAINKKMDKVLLVVQDQKEMFNTVIIRVNKLIDELNA